MSATLKQPVNVCPLVSMYGTYGPCEITTCQHHNLVTDTGCLLRDRRERSDRNPITDTEVLHYIIRPNSDKFDSKSLDKKFAGYVKKKYVTATKSNMIFYMYVQYVAQKCTPHPQFTYVPGVCKFIDNMIGEFPFNQIEVEFYPWMLPRLASPKVFNTFLNEQSRTIKEKISLINVLGLTPGKYKNLCMYIREYEKSKQPKTKTPKRTKK